MEIFIYFPSRLPHPRSEIEDDLDHRLGERGEVTGGGAGEDGANIDIEVFEGQPAEYLPLIRDVLDEHEVPDDTYIVIGDQRHPLHEGGGS